MLNHLSQNQIDIISLWYVVQHSLPSFYKIQSHFDHLKDALDPKNTPVWVSLGIHKNHIKRLQELHNTESQTQLKLIIESIQRHSDFLITIDDHHYPTQLLPYIDKPPIFFGQGNAQALLQPQIAIVGSRKSSPHGRQIAYDFSFYLAEKGFYINSGLALGIDEAAHQGGLKHQRTIAVMGTGLDSTYPSQHQNLRNEIIQNNGAVITEFLPFSKPLQQNFPRRNRIVSGLSLGVIVAEASLDSGSLITAKIAAEQGKTVFAIPGHIYNQHHQGCHQLIREGAILVDHPEQVIEDLALPTQWQSLQSEASQSQNYQSDTTTLPDYLLPLYNHLDWSGQTIDNIALHLDLDIATLTSYLMELELLGMCLQQSGLYLRCRVQ